MVRTNGTAGQQSTATKPPPPIRIKRRQSATSATSETPPLAFSAATLGAGAAASVATVGKSGGDLPVLETVPSGPTRTRFQKRVKGDCVFVINLPWSSPFRILETDPGGSRWEVHDRFGRGRGAGTLCTPPAGFEPIPCLTP